MNCPVNDRLLVMFFPVSTPLHILKTVFGYDIYNDISS